MRLPAYDVISNHDETESQQFTEREKDRPSLPFLQVQTDLFYTGQGYQSLDIESSATLLAAPSSGHEKAWTFKQISLTLITVAMAMAVFASIATTGSYQSADKLGSYTNKPLEVFEFRPWSEVSPESTGLKKVRREVYEEQMPGLGGMPNSVFARYEENGIPLLTNNWANNIFLGQPSNTTMNNAFVIPYVIDTAGYVPGIRVHSPYVTSSATSVTSSYEIPHGITIGAIEVTDGDFQLVLPGSADNLENDITKVPSGLSFSIEFTAAAALDPAAAPASFIGHISRGSPYITAEYVDTTIHLVNRLSISRPLWIDAVPYPDPLPVGTIDTGTICGEGNGTFGEPFWVQEQLAMTFDTSDQTWIMYVPEPTEFVCSNVKPYNPPQLPLGTVPPPLTPYEETYGLGWFELKAVRPSKGFVRIALGNNCTSGQNLDFCDAYGTATDKSEYMHLLRRHSSTFTKESFISFETNDEVMETIIDFNAMDFTKGGVRAGQELLTFCLVNHRQTMLHTALSSNEVIYEYCMPTLHGLACPIVGSIWRMRENLLPVSFYAEKPMDASRRADVYNAILQDLTYTLPENYVIGAGDTYFSGKMLAKLARIILIAQEFGGIDPPLMLQAQKNLQNSIKVWLDGTAMAPMIYDDTWKGLINCGCNYNLNSTLCTNKFPECPSMTNTGMNFGNGFYNDHHFHYGYHIYAFAVAAKFDTEFGKKYLENILMFVRDIANPSLLDKHFTPFRLKDWFLGSSWASGLCLITEEPNTSGRDQESVSEAINAGEGVGLLGLIFSEVYQAENNTDEYLKFKRMHIFGRIIMTTEIRAAQTYWQIVNNNMTDYYNTDRVYPAIYAQNVVGNLWSLMMDFQTWFGSNPYLCYGIQLIPLTVSSVYRDNPVWVKDMIIPYNNSCMADAAYEGCVMDGWSIPLISSYAAIGQTPLAWEMAMQLNASVFVSSGGNGHSLTNLLWYIATRESIKTTEDIV